MSTLVLNRRHGELEHIAQVVDRVMHGILRGQSTMTPHEELAALQASTAPLCIICAAAFRARGWRVCESCLGDLRDPVEGAA